MIEKIKTGMVCLIINSCFLIIVVMILASRKYPDGHSGNYVIDYLLSNITIQTVVVEDRWVKDYPFEKTAVEQYISKVNSIEKSLNSFCTVSFPAGEKIDRFVTLLKKKVYHYNLAGISGIYENYAYVEDDAEHVVEFKDRLGEMGIPFFYVQTPSLEAIQYYQGTKVEGDKQKIVERSFCLTSILESLDVDVINIARDYGNGISFDSSEHWMPSDGLNCAAIVADHLNHDYGFGIDCDIYRAENFHDLMEENFEKKETIANNRGYDFVVPVPCFDTEYRLVYAEDTMWEGDFRQTMIRSSDEWNMEGGAYHNVYRMSNSLIFEITNNMASEDKKILIIGDSFDWVVSTYLSLGVRNVTVIHNASFTGSLISYVKKMKPDIVIMIYNDAEFYEIYTEEAYYLQ